MNYIFKSNFYTVYRAPNADELINKINTYTDDSIDNAHFTWGSKSRSDKIPLKWEDYMELLLPSIKLFGEEFKVDIEFQLFDPWINFYKRGDHQEVHGHHSHISAVFLGNDGEDFSKFYFIDSNWSQSSNPLEMILTRAYTYDINLKAGDVMFFPSYMLHGVSPHKSDIVRKSLSFNFDINKVKKW